MVPGDTMNGKYALGKGWPSSTASVLIVECQDSKNRRLCRLLTPRSSIPLDDCHVPTHLIASSGIRRVRPLWCSPLRVRPFLIPCSPLHFSSSTQPRARVRTRRGEHHKGRTRCNSLEYLPRVSALPHPPPPRKFRDLLLSPMYAKECSTSTKTVLFVITKFIKYFNKV